jgi:hypothetical protein
MTTLILSDVMAEAARLLDEAEAVDLMIRLIGGTAIRLHSDGPLVALFEREIRDIDLVTNRGQGRRVGDFLERQGYDPNRTFNAMHGARRLLFYDEPNGRQIDVFIETFEMCHVLPVAEHLHRSPRTLPLADLLLTKLQIITLNAKDRSDSYLLLADHGLGGNDPELIDTDRIADLCARDWGLYRTIQLNLERLAAGLPESPLSEADRARVAERITGILAAMQRASKSVKWKARARVGDRVRWYEEPEEVDHGRY